MKINRQLKVPYYYQLYESIVENIENNKLVEGDKLAGEMELCESYGVSRITVRQALKELELKTIPDITNAIKAGGACMSCHHAPGGLQDQLDEVWGRPKAKVREAPELRVVSGDGGDAGPELSPYQFAKSVERVVNEYIRPMLQRDGGDLEIVDIKDHLVYTRFAGACAGCVGARMTLKTLVEGTLKNQVDERVRVIAL